MVGRKSLVVSQIRPIFDAVLNPTLSLITQDFIEFPDHRMHFFRFLRSVNRHCFSGSFSGIL